MYRAGRGTIAARVYHTQPHRIGSRWQMRWSWIKHNQYAVGHWQQILPEAGKIRNDVGAIVNHVIAEIGDVGCPHDSELARKHASRNRTAYPHVGIGA